MKKIKQYKTEILTYSLFILFVMPLLYRFHDFEGTKRVLSANNYTSIEVFTVGYPKAAFVCGRDDIYVTGFTAIAPNGTKVTGYVTKGFWKGSTIRLN